MSRLDAVRAGSMEFAAPSFQPRLRIPGSRADSLRRTVAGASARSKSILTKCRRQLATRAGDMIMATKAKPSKKSIMATSPSVPDVPFNAPSIGRS
jgi:hypothetical protein